MTWMDEVNDAVTHALAEQERAIDAHINNQFRAAAEDEKATLQSLGVTIDGVEVAPDQNQRIDNLRRRLRGQSTDYMEAFRSAVLDELDRNGDVSGLLNDIFTPGPEGGLVLDHRGDLEPVKRVDPNGNARMQSQRIDYIWYATPSGFFEWLTSMAVVEARNAGRVAVHDQVEEVVGEVWVDPLTERTTPMAARLHGTEWAIDDMPFLPPITQLGQSRIHPVFEADSILQRTRPSAAAFDAEREEWFVQYHEMRQGDAPQESFTDHEVDVDGYNLSFIYRSYLPRNITQYLPKDAE